MESEDILTAGRRAIETEAQAIAALGPRLGADFVAAVEAVLSCERKVVVTGMGKAGAIGRKLAGTLCSTGTPAVFLSPAEGVHGDLGTVQEGDLVLVLSYSGETEEVVRILPALRRVGAHVVAITGRSDATLARNSDLVLDVAVEREADPHNLAPTASTAAMHALGDALALAAMQARRFTPEDFARFHPGGALGRRLLLTVADVMRSGSDHAVVSQGQAVREALWVMTAAPIRGVVNVVNDEGRLVGVFTDGDLRRGLERDSHLLDRSMEQAMARHPTVITPDRLATEALHLLQEKEFDNLPVVDEQGRAVGIVDVQDLLRAGIV